MSEFFEMFTYGFVVRAFIVGVMVALCASLLGVTLVLKKYSMIGDGLSHVGFGAMTIALALNVAPLYIAVPVMFVSAFFLLKLRENSSINTDAAIAVISGSSIAVGVLAASLSGGLNVDVYSYMFGSILAVTKNDVIISSVLCMVILFIYVFCYNRIFSVTFDEGFASASGIKTNMFNTLFAMLTAATIIIGMRIMGTMLISGLIIFPAITAMKLFDSYKKVTVSAAVISVIAFIMGMTLSCLFTYVPAGAGVIIMNLIFLIVAMVISRIKRS